MRKLRISITHPQVGTCVNLIVSEDNLAVVLQALVRYDFWGDIEIVEPMIVPCRCRSRVANICPAAPSP
jgi:hypothetical protein